MKLHIRILRFGLVGVFATVVHYGCLFVFAFYLPLWLANSLAFTISFFVSFVFQQRYTFLDRLGSNNHLNFNAGLLIFSLNVISAAIAGLLIKGKYALFLPLMPSVINYCLFYYLPRLKIFVKSK